MHPSRRLETLSAPDRVRLHRGLMETLLQAVELGGLAYEEDLYNQPRGFKEFLVGYREGQGCPVCGGIIQKIKAAGSASYVCPNCQR